MNQPQSVILGKLRPSSARPKMLNIVNNKTIEILPCIQRNIKKYNDDSLLQQLSN